MIQKIKSSIPVSILIILFHCYSLLSNQSYGKLSLTSTEVIPKKPGDTTLPSTEKELEELAALEQGRFKYTVEDYIAKPKLSKFQLSPDGRHLSYRKKGPNLKNSVYVKDLRTGKVKRVIEEKDELIRGYAWANNSRLVYVMDRGGNENYHLLAVNIDGTNQKELTPFDGVQASILELLSSDTNHIIISMNKNNPQVFEPYRINVNSGDLTLLYKNEDVFNPITEYNFDKEGKLQGFSRLIDGVRLHVYHQTLPGNFEKIKEMEWDECFTVISYDYASEYPHDAYVLSNLHTDKTQILKYDLVKDKVIKNLFSHDKYDVAGASFSKERDWELDYFTYTGDKYNIVPVSSYFKKLHQRITKKFPNYEYRIADQTDDESKYLIYITSDKLFGRYYLYNVAKDEFDSLFDLMPQLNEKDMAEMRPITFTSRDGKTIHGYITLPPTALNGERVPVIVNPHGGPQTIRDSWGFNREAQLFASRGYATLQVNFRISGGYGKKFLRSGYKQIGRKVMNDIEDGLAHVVEKGWVDSAKVAIYGCSHGGYATLRGMTKTPDLYACGVAYCGVSNLFTFINTIPAYWKPYIRMLKAIWYDEDIPQEKEIMKTVSPIFHVNKLEKPLFVIQGANDPRVTIDESDQIVRALRKRGLEVPYMVKYNEGHGFYNEENRIALYKAMLGFFAANLK